jgi:hypothetical protein
MADTKITALTAISTVDPAADVLAIVDVSDTTMAASGTTKKITSNQLLGAGGTATLASATITGDLLVDTNTFYVNSAANRVLIGTLSALGSATLSIAGKTQSDTAVAGDVIGNFNNSSATGFGFRIGGGSATGGYALSVNNNAGSEFHQISGTGIATWSNVGGVAGTAMTLNATGLAIGDTAFAGTRLTLRESASQPNGLAITNRNATQTWRVGVDVSAVDDKILGFYDSTSTAFRVQLYDTGHFVTTVPTTPPTLGLNSTAVWNLTSNTNLRVSVRGTDGVTRVANITLA